MIWSTFEANLLTYMNSEVIILAYSVGYVFVRFFNSLIPYLNYKLDISYHIDTQI